MSLSDTQQMMVMLAEIEDLLTKIEAKSTAVAVELPRTKEVLYTFRQIERLALRWLVIARRMGLPEDVEGAINKISRLIVSIRMLQMSINLLYATNPLTVGAGVAGGILAAMSFSDAFVGY